MNRFLIGAGAIFAPFAISGALAPARDRTPNTTVALLVTLSVVALGTTVTQRMALFAALSGGVGFDLFHTRPYGSLQITRLADVETTVLLVAIGVVVGQLASRSRMHQADAAGAGRDVERLHELAEMVAGGAPVGDVVTATTREITEILRLRSCVFDGALSDRPGPFVERHGAVTWGQIGWKISTFGLPSKPISLVIEHQAMPLGRFVLRADPAELTTARQLLVAVALADQAGAAIAAQGAPLEP